MSKARTETAEVMVDADVGSPFRYRCYSANGSPMGVATASFKYMVFQDPAWDWKTLNMENDIAYGRGVLRTINVADNPNLKPFLDPGGDLLWYHGWMDGASPLESVKYMKAVEETVGAEQTQRSMRLFAIPGMGHCSGGTGCDTFDKLAELDRGSRAARRLRGSLLPRFRMGRLCEPIHSASIPLWRNTREQAI